MARDSVVREKSFAFAVRVVRCSRYLQNEKREFVLSKQLLRSGTAIGALVREAEQGESRADFVHKLSIALKESHETDYWIDLLEKTDYLRSESCDAMKSGIVELIRLLTSIINKTKATKT